MTMVKQTKEDEVVFYCPHCCKFFIGDRPAANHRYNHQHRLKEVKDIELKERVIATYK